jgi:membrane protein
MTLHQHRYNLFIINVFKNFVANQGVRNAAALTYTTLFAVVPLMTVTYAMLAAIPSVQGAGDGLQAWIFDNFVPATGHAVQDYLSGFADQAKSLTGVGIVMLILTSILMMKTIENTFNFIWRVKEPRKGLSSFLLYWAVLSLGPILMGLGLVLTSYITSLSLISSATELVGRQRVLGLVPVAMSCMAFTLLYMAVPNCRVPFKSAVLGGIVVALLFEGAKRGFTLFVTDFSSYQLIYGAFAAFPLFLLWVFFSWIIILMGAELTRAITVYTQTGVKAQEPHLYTVIAVLEHLWQAQQQGASVPDYVLLKQVSGLNQSRWDDYQQLLIAGDIIKRTEQGEYILSRDLHDITIYQLNQLLPWSMPHTSSDLPDNFNWQQTLNQHIERINNVSASELSPSLVTLLRIEDARER